MSQRSRMFVWLVILCGLAVLEEQRAIASWTALVVGAVTYGVLLLPTLR